MTKSKNNNILLVGNWSSDTGYAWWLMETLWVAIANRFAREGCSYLVYPKVAAVSERISAACIVVEEFDLSNATMLELFQYLSNRQISTVYLTDRAYLGLCYLVMRLAGVRNVVLHDHSPGIRTPPSGLRMWLKWVAMRMPWVSPTQFLAVSEEIYSRLLKVGCIPAHRCFLVRNGVNITAIEAAPAANIRSESGIPPGALLVVSCGRITEYKRVDVIVDAASSLLLMKPTQEVHFIHCGEGPEMATLEARVERLGMGGRFHFLGARSDVISILKVADIAVHASMGEGLSLAILEFMAAGLPVVVSDDPTVSQSVTDGVSGLTFRTGDSSDLAEKLRRLLADPLERKTMGAEAKRVAKVAYSLDATLKTLADVMEGIAANGR